MTNSIGAVISHVVKYFAIGGVVGLVVSIFTIAMIMRVAKRTRYYEPTYVPIRLAEPTLWHCVFISYPIIFAIGFAVASFLKT